MGPGLPIWPRMRTTVTPLTTRRRAQVGAAASN
jgi:hypothetical protein